MNLRPSVRKWRRPVLALAASGAVLVVLRIAAPNSPSSPFRAPSPASPGFGSGQTPARVGSISLCFADAPFRAYADRRVYYPPNHPSLPPSEERPTRCFRTRTEAVYAGYRLAPPPEGDQVVAGVYFEPTEAALVTACRQAARRLGIPVPCPELMPSQEAGTGPVRCGEGPAPESMRGCVFTNLLPGQRHSLFLLIERTLALPPEYGDGQMLLTSTVVLKGYPEELSRDVAADYFVGCVHASLDSMTQVGSTPARFILCDEGPEGTLVLRWAPPFGPRKVIVEIGLRGNLEPNHQILLAVAEHIRMVGPD
jgi:hypothetical protein